MAKTGMSFCSYYPSWLQQDSTPHTKLLNFSFEGSMLFASHIIPTPEKKQSVIVTFNLCQVVVLGGYRIKNKKK